MSNHDIAIIIIQAAVPSQSTYWKEVTNILAVDATQQWNVTYLFSTILLSLPKGFIVMGNQSTYLCSNRFVLLGDPKTFLLNDGTSSHISLMV